MSLETVLRYAIDIDALFTVISILLLDVISLKYLLKLVCLQHVLRELPSSPVPASCCTALLEAYSK